MSDGDPLRAITGFICDAARSGRSMWTVVNVLRHWRAEGTPLEHMSAAVAQARTMIPGYDTLLQEYQHGIETHV